MIQPETLDQCTETAEGTSLRYRSISIYCILFISSLHVCIEALSEAYGKDKHIGFLKRSGLDDMAFFFWKSYSVCVEGFRIDVCNINNSPRLLSLWTSMNILDVYHVHLWVYHYRVVCCSFTNFNLFLYCFFVSALRSCTYLRLDATKQDPMIVRSDLGESSQQRRWQQYRIIMRWPQPSILRPLDTSTFTSTWVE